MERGNRNRCSPTELDRHLGTGAFDANGHISNQKSSYEGSERRIAKKGACQLDKVEGLSSLTINWRHHQTFDRR